MNGLLLAVMSVVPVAAVCVPAQTVLQTYPALPNDLDWFALGDVDGDGIRDVAIQRNSGVVDIYSCTTGALHLQIAPVPPSLAVLFFSSVGDVDGDGHDDLGYTESGPGAILGHVASGLTGTIIYTYSGNMILEELGDINVDGKAEFLRGDPATGRADVIDGATGVQLRSHFGTYQNHYLGGLRSIGDADADGIADYVVRSNIGSWVGYSGLTGQLLFQGVLGDYLDPIGDFNADGYDDFAVAYHPCMYPCIFSSTWHVLVLGGPSATPLWIHMNTFPNPAPVNYTPPTGWAGDLDGDGHDDLALGSWVAGAAYGTVLSGRNQSTLLQTTRYGLKSPGDANGDGVPDFLAMQWQLPWPQPGNTWMVQLFSGIAPGAASIGTPCPDSTGVSPTIGIGIGARLGETMTVNLSRANPNLSLAVLGMGFSDQQWNSVPLPIDLGAYGMPGCQWYVAADHGLWLPTAGLNGTRHHAQHPIPVPAATGLLGTVLYFQWLVVEPNPAGLSGAVTRAMSTTVVQ